MLGKKINNFIEEVSLKKEASFFYSFLVFALVFLLGANFLTKPLLIPRSEYLTPPAVIKYMLSGLKTQASDSFWLRAVQDFDYCDNLINKTECKGKSWLYEILDLTTDLDPTFYVAAYYGGLALTIVISDYEGASKIFDKGIAAFPTKWNINYAAGYHALFEEKDKVKAAKRFLAAAKNGGPEWLASLAARLAKEGGEQEYAVQILKNMIETTEDPKIVEHLKAKLLTIQQSR